MSRVHLQKPFGDRNRGYGGGDENVVTNNQASFRAQRQKEGIQIDSRSQAYVAPTHLPVITSKTIPVSNLVVPPSPNAGRSRYSASRQSRPTSQQINTNNQQGVIVRKTAHVPVMPGSALSVPSNSATLPGSALPPLKTREQPQIRSTPVLPIAAAGPRIQQIKWMPHGLSLFEKCEIQLYDSCLAGCGDIAAFNNSIKGVVFDRSRLSELYSVSPSRNSAVYYTGNNRPHNFHLQSNDQFPIADSYTTNKLLYRVVPGDHVAFRYEVVKLLGKGSYGIVLLCRDHASNTMVALKILKKKTVEAESSQREREVLRMMTGPITLPGLSIASQGNVPANSNALFTAQASAVLQAEDHVANLLNSFRFRGFECLVLEQLHLNQYSFLKQNNFKLEERTAVALIHSTLLGVFALHQRQIVHCDVKPENLLLTVATPPNGQVLLNELKVKVIDFGTSWQRGHTNPQYYVQSRYYRAPEVLLELPYSDKIDVFSVGCMVSELITGQPLFVSGNELEHLYRLMEVFGPPSPDILRNSKKRSLLVSSQGLLLSYDPQRLGRAVPEAAPIAPFGSKLLHKTLKYNHVTYDYNRLSLLPAEAFSVKDPKDPSVTLYPYTRVPVHNNPETLLQWLIVDFIWCCLGWDHTRRMSATQALRHPLMMRGFKWQEAIQETNAVSDYIERTTQQTQPSPGKPNSFAQTQQAGSTQILSRGNTFPHQRRVF